MQIITLSGPYTWPTSVKLAPISYRCGYCGEKMKSQEGYTSREASTWSASFPSGGTIYICSTCGSPTMFDHIGDQFPAPWYDSNRVQSLPEIVEEVFREANICQQNGCYTATVMLYRKLLMHLAVEKGDKPGKGFVQYVDYLETNHYFPPGGEEWGKKIKDLGNDANHEIVIMGSEEAELISTTMEMLLKFIYEYPEKFRDTTS